MHPTISQAIDRFIIKRAAAVQPKPGQRPGRCAEARQLLESSDFFCDSTQPASGWEWTSPVDFQFPSQIDSPWPETKTVHGKLHRLPGDWAKQPTVILIHGWNDDLGYHFRHPAQARHFLKLGLNVAMIELPYHLQRRPRGRKKVRDFISEDVYSTMLATQQSISDLRALIGWLQAEGCARLGLWGVSLGGWLAGLVSSCDERVRFATLNVPVVRMDRVINELAFCAPIKHSVAESHFDLERLNLRSRPPLLPRDQILVVEAEDDLFAPKDAIEELVQAWGSPEIWRVRQAHITFLFSQKIFYRTADWVAEKALALECLPK